MERSIVITEAAQQIPESQGDDCTLVAVDGRDAAGKTMFARELASACKMASGRSVIRISLDDFHNARPLRYRLGKQSPRDSTQTATIMAVFASLFWNRYSPVARGYINAAVTTWRRTRSLTMSRLKLRRRLL